MTPMARSLLTALTVCCFAALFVLPIEGFAVGVSCRCLRTPSTFIHPRQFKRLEIIPLGAHCRQTEILITLKNDRTVCANPNAKWIKNVIERVIPKDNQKVQE
ncbi:hypothetical protein ANANG_G00196290 [Anguilla anguilla]|uniref:Chemokine interleukin-8-like domain-containing protein n=1 Tax=Anguilla anguilla TaxID=7936 RepID=A0A9D3M213_ANGAN|nr:hypothetical protein ANANG_G00196290 [Anguilla anguilla]